MRTIPDPGFAGDVGAVDPDLAAALAAYDRAGPDEQVAAHHEVLALLQDTRVLVPVVALLGEVGDDGSDKTSDMAAVLMTGRDGRTALLAFTGAPGLTSWNPDARPVPVTARDAARAALQDDAAALLVDVAGPVLFVVEGEDLGALAAGHRFVRLEDAWAWTSSTLGG